jgi:hypothetical protein
MLNKNIFENFQLYAKNTVGAVCISNTKSITSEDFATIFTMYKQNFWLFSFWILNFPEFAVYKKQEKKVWKNFVLMVKNFVQKIKFFVFADFLLPLFSAADNFCQI